ncbi:MAG: hypothetical protein L0I76_21500 [Pseudonocardia sp.]|nr:hypothetical protein [Pseudonocardia sp.]
MWDVLVDPDLLPKLTPLLSRVEADGDRWRWHLVRLKVLGIGISPVFTERMTFDEGRRIAFTHDPPTGVTEWAGAEGHYELSDVDGGTHLSIELTLHVDLPLSRLASPVVTRTMQATMQMMGDRFSANLLRQLKARQR